MDTLTLAFGILAAIILLVQQGLMTTELAIAIVIGAKLSTTVP